MYASPKYLQKYLYITKTPTWKIRTLYLFGLISWLLVLYGFRGVTSLDPFYKWFVTPVLGIITVYHLLSFGINATYRQFDIPKHRRYVREFWKRHKREPSVDIFLPICGEEMGLLKNTWTHVKNLQYKNKKVYVLDDSSSDCDAHEKLARSFKFNYIERPNKGWNKKAGNLKYAYKRTNGEFITIFDADFAPSPEFLNETLPYTSDPKVGIVQTPQFFDMSARAYKQSPLGYGAAYQEEFFYRIIQVAKDRFNSAICCGSNAIYRRSALKTIGGPVQVTASEDSRTGFALLSKGWITRYVPIILAVGKCPDNVYAYYHQQHRWCRGRSELVLSKNFRKARVSLFKKIINTTGFLAFLLRPLEILLSFQLFWVLFLYNDFISFQNSIIFYFYLFFSLYLIPLFHITKFKKEALLASSIQAFAASHSIISVFFGRRVGWIATNAKHTTISPAFRQTTIFVSVYLGLYITLIFIGLRTGDIHLFTFKYWSVQFWILWNLVLTASLLRQLLSHSATATAQPSLRVRT